MATQVKLQKAYTAAISELEVADLKKVMRRSAKHWGTDTTDDDYTEVYKGGDADTMVEYVTGFEPWDDEDDDLGQLSFYRSLADAGLIERPSIDPEEEEEEEEEEPKPRRGKKVAEAAPKRKRAAEDEDRPRKKAKVGGADDLSASDIKAIKAALKKSGSVGGAFEITGIPHRIIREAVPADEREALGVRVRRLS